MIGWQVEYILVKHYLKCITDCGASVRNNVNIVNSF